MDDVALNDVALDISGAAPPERADMPPSALGAITARSSTAAAPPRRAPGMGAPVARLRPSAALLPAPATSRRKISRLRWATASLTTRLSWCVLALGSGVRGAMTLLRRKLPGAEAVRADPLLAV